MRTETKNLIQQLLEEAERKKIREENLSKLTVALEHQTYKTIPGTSSSVRIDPENTNTKTQKHAHAYAKRYGQGKEIYSVNMDGSGHDGSSGKTIPKSHAIT